MFNFMKKHASKKELKAEISRLKEENEHLERECSKATHAADTLSTLIEFFGHPCDGSLNADWHYDANPEREQTFDEFITECRDIGNSAIRDIKFKLLYPFYADKQFEGFAQDIYKKYHIDITQDCNLRELLNIADLSCLLQEERQDDSVQNSIQHEEATSERDETNYTEFDSSRYRSASDAYYAPDFTKGYDLPEGWCWHCYDDGSGSLCGPNNQHYFHYDLSTGEMTDEFGNYSECKDSAWIKNSLQRIAA